MTQTDVLLGPIVEGDVHDVARLHRAAFPTFFLSQLGEPFLVQFYRGFIDEPSAVAVVARTQDGRPIGAVVGTVEPAAFFGRLVRRRWLGFTLASIRAVGRHPSTASRLVRAVRYRGDAPPGGGIALLSSICVDPNAQGAGIGHRLIDAWTSTAASRGASTAFLDTDGSDNDAVNSFYRTQGWHLSGFYRTRGGRGLNRYEKQIIHRC